MQLALDQKSQATLTTLLLTRRYTWSPNKRSISSLFSIFSGFSCNVLSLDSEDNSDFFNPRQVSCIVIPHEQAQLLSPASTWRHEPGELAPVERLLQLKCIKVSDYVTRIISKRPFTCPLRHPKLVLISGVTACVPGWPVSVIFHAWGAYLLGQHVWRSHGRPGNFLSHTSMFGFGAESSFTKVIFLAYCRLWELHARRLIHLLAFTVSTRIFYALAILTVWLSSLPSEFLLLLGEIHSDLEFDWWYFSAVPIDFKVERIRDGQTFATRQVQAMQKGKICFTMYASFQVTSRTLSWKIWKYNYQTIFCLKYHSNHCFFTKSSTLTSLDYHFLAPNTILCWTLSVTTLGPFELLFCNFTHFCQCLS